MDKTLIADLEEVALYNDAATVVIIERAIAALRAVREAVPDAARYAELKRRYAAADFHYGEPPGCVLVFDVPQDVRVSANLDDTIDRLIAPTQDQENGS